MKSRILKFFSIPFIVFFMYAGTASAATVLLEGGTDLAQNEGSNYSDNGGGFLVDTETAPWVYGPFLFGPNAVRLYLFTSAASSPCNATEYVQISSNGTDWLDSEHIAITATTEAQAVTFRIVGPLLRSDFAHIRLRHDTGSCSVGSVYFKTNSATDSQSWNIIPPPPASDEADVGFQILGDVTDPGNAPQNLEEIFIGSTAQPELCAETVTWTWDTGANFWGNLEQFFVAFIASAKNSFWDFFWVGCSTLKPFDSLRQDLLTHAPFRQAIWLAMAMQDAITNETATSSGDFVLTAPPPFDAGTLTIFDADAIYALFGSIGGWGTYVRPTLSAVTLLLLAVYFWKDAQEFFTGMA